MREFEVVTAFDEEAKVYYVKESDIPGLATEAETLDALKNRVLEIAPELIEMNGTIQSVVSEPTAPVSFIAHEQLHLARA